MSRPETHYPLPRLRGKVREGVSLRALSKWPGGGPPPPPPPPRPSPASGGGERDRGDCGVATK
jgi:hypothetical protein